MIIITTVDTKYFTLDGVTLARIYQPLAQGSEAIGLYSIYDTRQQLINSTKYDEFEIDGSTYATQELTIAALLDVIYSAVSDYDVELLEARVEVNEGKIENLEENQVTGVVVYDTLADLPAIGTLLVSYKVSNDTTVSNNGFYHWSGSAYVKDADSEIARYTQALSFSEGGFSKLWLDKSKGVIYTTIQETIIDAIEICQVYNAQDTYRLAFFSKNGGTYTARIIIREGTSINHTFDSPSQIDGSAFDINGLNKLLLVCGDAIVYLQIDYSLFSDGLSEFPYFYVAKSQHVYQGMKDLLDSVGASAVASANSYTDTETAGFSDEIFESTVPYWFSGDINNVDTASKKSVFDVCQKIWIEGSTGSLTVRLSSVLFGYSGTDYLLRFYVFRADTTYTQWVVNLSSVDKYVHEQVAVSMDGETFNIHVIANLYRGVDSGSGIIYNSSNSIFNVREYDEEYLTDIFNEFSTAAAFKYFYTGRKLMQYGDSITASDGYYMDEFVALVNPLSYTNKGVSGNTVSAMLTRLQADLVATPTLLDDIDLLSFFIGTNDYNGSVALGTVNDDPDVDTTYCALLMKAIEVSFAANPLIKIMLITILNRNFNFAYGAPNSAGYTVLDMCEKIREIGEKYSVPVCDFNKQSGWNEDTLSTVSADGVHPSSVGGTGIARLQANFTNTIG